jgi:hypothetical protein
MIPNNDDPEIECDRVCELCPDCGFCEIGMWDWLAFEGDIDRPGEEAPGEIETLPIRMKPKNEHLHRDS